MYIIGHTAFAYLITRPLVRIDNDRYVPEILLFIFIFANIIDSIHITPYLRMLGHNLIGLFLYSGVWLLFFYKAGIIKKGHVPVLLLAVASHMIMDYLFGEFFFLFPISDTPFTIFSFNTYRDFITESFLAGIFIVVFVLTGDLKKMRFFIGRELRRFYKYCSFKNFYRARFYKSYLFIAFYLFVTGQIVVFIRINHCLSVFNFWYKIEFFIMALLFLLVMSLLILGDRKRSLGV